MKTLKRLLATVAAGVLATLPLAPADAGPTISNPNYNWAALDAYLGGGTNPIDRGALVIYHKGQVVYRKNFGAWAGTNWENLSRNVASVSKSYGAAIAMMADEDPYINFSIQDNLTTHFPTVTNINPAYATMTMRQLLAMTAGVPALNIGNSCLGDDVNYTFASCVRTDIVPRALYQSAAPGSYFVYSGGDWNVMGYGLLNAYNIGYSVQRNWGQLAADYLFDECGWTATRYQQTNNFWVGGGIETNLDEGGEMAQLLLSGTCTNAANQSVQRLSLNSLIKMRQDQWLTAQLGVSAYGNLGGGRENRKYGYGLFHNNAGPLAAYNRNSLFFGPGAWGSHLFIDTVRGYSGFLYVKDSFANGTTVFETIVPLIEPQIEANN